LAVRDIIINTDNFNFSLTHQVVALKEIRLQEEEGAPFTAIRYKYFKTFLFLDGKNKLECFFRGHQSYI
jgi:hypothetical protein